MNWTLKRNLVCTLGVASLAALTSIPTRAGEWDKKTNVTFGQRVEVPGAVLPPGKYVIKLHNSSSNRNIVQILNAREDHVFSTSFAIPVERRTPTDAVKFEFYEAPAGKPEALRTWFYPGDTTGREFAYPKNRVAEIGKYARAQVPLQPADFEAPPDQNGQGNSATPSAAIASAAKAPAEASPASALSESSSDESSTAESNASTEPNLLAQNTQPTSQSTAEQRNSPETGENQLPHTAGSLAGLTLAGMLLIVLGWGLRLAPAAAKKH